jgi:hypothetical protein
MISPLVLQGTHHNTSRFHFKWKDIVFSNLNVTKTKGRANKKSRPFPAFQQKNLPVGRKQKILHQEIPLVSQQSSQC